ncbi:facilitated trehalose transporter Tret1 [Scaptodrosophila lebanonensis]|uniref:Facilitated trehalose transporter Tret1 n=1 Tax=Drosophila lebanonensis TaxID=7225 RepID=A0A6J2U9X2_DROLE|nr:facilitated trehalose transporter Tret1 [Scaptodrosophila lebanonensis]
MASSGGVKYQYLAGFCANIISVSYGAFCGWPSASFLELQADNSPLESGPLSNSDAGWVSSTLCLGGVVGTIVFARLADKLGRKPALLLMALPSLIGWLILPYARNPIHLCVARFLGGSAGGGCFAVIPIYVVELAESRVRGILGTFVVLGCNLGVLAAFTMGYFFNYKQVAWMMSILPLLFIICFVFMPETPQFLLQCNKLEEAEHALRYYRNIKKRVSKELSEELKLELRQLRTPEKGEEADANVNSAITLADFLEPKARKAFLIGIGLAATNQICGAFAMLNYTGVIFQQSGSTLPPTLAAIIVGTIQILGTYISTLLVERAGRKVLMLVSAAGIGISQCAMGTYSYLTLLGYETGAFSWVPIVGFSVMMLVAAVGLLTVPIIVLSEIMPVKIRSMAYMIFMAFLWLLTGFMLKSLPIFSESLGMHGTVFLFAVGAFASGLFIAIFVPETKGKSIETILDSM